MKNIFEVYGSNYFHGVGKKYACFIFLSFLNEVTSLQYQVIKDQISWGLNTNANQYELYHYYVSNILQRIKRVIKMWWYKLFFSKYVFEQNFLYERQRCSLLLFHFSRILHFSFSSFFNIFLLSVFFVFSIFSAPLPLTKETMILAKYHSKMTLTQDCQIVVSISKKTLTTA